MEQPGAGMIQPGKWVNKITGEEVYVRDSLIDGDKMVVMTNKGQLSMSEFTNYIQCEDGEVIPTLADLYGKKDPSLLSKINQGIDSSDRIQINQNNNQTNNVTLNNNTITQTPSINEQKKENPNYNLIKKVFDKHKIERTIKFEIVEEEWPFKEFNMLVNVLDVPLKDICDYVIENYLDKEHLSESLSEYFSQHIYEN